MSTIPIEVSTEQLLQAVERLPASELDAFVARVNALRARQKAPHLSESETTLLLAINRASRAPDQQARFDELVAKRQGETISPAELDELIALTEAAEQRDVERLQALSDLAQLRGTTVPMLMDALGIKAPAYG
jgi:uncharacterized protein YkwD